MEEEPEEAAVNKREGRNNAGGLERHDVLYNYTLAIVMKEVNNER